MPEVKHVAVVLIGDLVGSRRSADRAALHARLAEVLAATNAAWGSDLRVTAGDEYQGTFASPGDALRATLALRVAMLPGSDVRHGIGIGEVETLDPRALVQDGPGWWAARAAIVAAQEAQRSARTRSCRTACRVAEGATGPDPAAVDAALLGRDELVGRLTDRSLSVLRGLLGGRTQRDIAEAEGVSTSAISQRVRHDGLGVVLAIDELLGGMS